MRAWLLQRNVKLEERDFFKERFSANEMIDLIGDQPASRIFSWKSPSFRKFGVDKDDLSDDQLVAMMLEEPRLIRRPLVKIGDVLLVGADLDALSDALG